MLDKILIIIIILLIFYYIISINIETFATKQYTNTNQYSWERNNINSLVLLIGFELNVSIKSLKSIATDREIEEKKNRTE